MKKFLAYPFPVTTAQEKHFTMDNRGFPTINPQGYSGKGKNMAGKRALTAQAANTAKMAAKRAETGTPEHGRYDMGGVQPMSAQP
ncbi:hypothetical protein [Shewanella sp. YIC-542]|uniref:hypothetical protein n=1 Tax=Shewanella mytili TaxID=3377111 RepID=UPI00398F3635